MKFKTCFKKIRDYAKRHKDTSWYIMGSKKPAPTEYRTRQNFIKESSSGQIAYLPPEAKDIPKPISELIAWLNKNKNEIPVSILAAIAHYQYATIYPYYDGNGRTARISTALILHLNGYDLKGIYNPEEYYTKNLQDYYSVIDIGESHNYYLGSADADIISRIEYFLTGIFESFSKIEKHLEREKGRKDKSDKLRIFDARQKKVLTLFKKNDYITSKDLEKLFKFFPRTARRLAQNLAKSGFLEIVDKSKKNRKYILKH